MKVLGVKQFHQKTFKLLPLKSSKFKDILGKVPKFFTAVIYGFSGNGKTEFSITLAKELSKYGKVLWLSYEQRHGYDLQSATKRNKMQQNSGKFLVADPLDNIHEETTLLEDLDNYLNSRASADYIFIDSLDYTGFTVKDYKYLKNKYFGKKGFIFIAHSTKNGIPNKAVTRDIIFDGGLGILVNDFIAFPAKNRFGGFTPYVVFEEQARERNPLFFTKREAAKNKPSDSKVAAKKSTETKGVTTENDTETIGVAAKKQS